MTDQERVELRQRINDLEVALRNVQTQVSVARVALAWAARALDDVVGGPGRCIGCAVSERDLENVGEKP